MTSPIAQGFPDWQRNAPAGNVSFVSAKGVTVPFTDYGIFWTGYTQSIGINWVSFGGIATLLLRFSSDPAGLVILDQYSFDVQFPGSVTFSVPAKGPWMRVEVTPVGGNITMDLAIFAQPLANRAMPISTSNILISQTNVALAAGASVSYDSLATWPGLAYIQAYQDVGAFTATLTAIPANPPNFNIWRSGDTVRPQPSSLAILPATPVRMTIHNTSAAPANHFVYMLGGWEP